MIAGVLVMVGVLLVLPGMALVALNAAWDRPKPSGRKVFAVSAVLGVGVVLMVVGMALAGGPA